MSSIEKAEIKMIAAQEIVERLRDRKKQTEKYLLMTQGGSTVIEAALEQLMGSHKRAERELDEKKITEEQFKIVKSYQASDLSILTKMLRGLKDQLPATKFRVEGIDQAMASIDEYYAIQGKHIDSIRAQDEELLSEEDQDEEDRQRRIAARENRSLEASPVRRHDELPMNGGGDPVGSPPEKTDEIPSKVPESHEESENTDPTPPTEEKVPPIRLDQDLCAHCHQEPIVAMGTCSACMSYRNKYKKLPGVNVIEARKKRKEPQNGLDSRS